MVQEIKNIQKFEAFDSIKSVLAYFFDSDYQIVDLDDIYEFKVSEMIDYLMIPLLNENEIFTLNSFITGHLRNSPSLLFSFIESINKILVFDDLIELILLIKAHISFNGKPDFEIVKRQLTETYLSQWEKLKELINQNKSMIDEYSLDRTKLLEMGRVNDMIKRTQSKKGLISAMDVIYQKTIYTLN